MSDRLKNIDAVVFDLDGTLISYPSGLLATKEHHRIMELVIRLKDRLGKRGISTYWKVRSGLKNLKDVGIFRMARERSSDFLEALSFFESPDRAVDLKRYGDALRRTLLNAYLRRVTLYPDVIPCLSTLSSEGFRLGLLSNSPSFICYGALDRFEIRQFFDQVSSTWSLKSFKPNPQIFLHMTRQLGVKPERTLFVGDSMDCDVQGAKNAGALSAYLIREHNPLRRRYFSQEEPDVILRSLDELPPMVRKITLRARIERILKPVLSILRLD